MNYQKEPNRIFALNDEGTIVAEITFPEKEKGLYVIDHTYVHNSLRGQGVARTLVEMALGQIEQLGGSAQATCSYAKKILDEKK